VTLIRRHPSIIGGSRPVVEKLRASRLRARVPLVSGEPVELNVAREILGNAPARFEAGGQVASCDSVALVGGKWVVVGGLGDVNSDAPPEFEARTKITLRPRVTLGRGKRVVLGGSGEVVGFVAEEGEVELRDRIPVVGSQLVVGGGSCGIPGNATAVDKTEGNGRLSNGQALIGGPRVVGSRRRKGLVGHIKRPGKPELSSSVARVGGCLVRIARLARHGECREQEAEWPNCFRLLLKIGNKSSS
jgi:hypothetical protein